MLVSAAFALFPPADNLCVSFCTYFCCNDIEAKGFAGFVSDPGIVFQMA